MQTNPLHGLPYEFGADLPQGRHKGIERIAGELAELEGVLPAAAVLVNKMARTSWALLARERTYQKGYVARAA